MASLISLNLGTNMLSGACLRAHRDLSPLRLTSSRRARSLLTGTIPASISNITTIPNVFLLLGNNQLSGTLPASMGNMSTLLLLDLSFNVLTGTMPSSFGALNNLAVLCVSWGRHRQEPC